MTLMDARPILVAMVVVWSDTVATCPNPRPWMCDQRNPWLTKQRWHANPHRKCVIVTTNPPSAGAGVR